jgi:uncharacterized protein YcfJ
MRSNPTPLIYKRLFPALVLALITTAPSQAGSYGSKYMSPPPVDPAANHVFQDTAWVVSSKPVYQEINQPRRECWEEQVGYEQREVPRGSGNNVGSAIFGGLVGGVLGNSIGKGDGRKAATAAGAVLGAIAGDKYADRQRGYAPSEPAVRIEQRCREVDNWTRKLTGYDVVYRYQGRDYSSFMPYDPGNRVRVNVSVSLAE